MLSTQHIGKRTPELTKPEKSDPEVRLTLSSFAIFLKRTIQSAIPFLS